MTTIEPVHPQPEWYVTCLPCGGFFVKMDGAVEPTFCPGCGRKGGKP